MTINIFDEEFELKRTGKMQTRLIDRYSSEGEDDIMKAYKYPSYIKCRVGDSGKMGATIHGITIKAIRNNGFFFSIGGGFKYNGELYFIGITSTHKYIYPMERKLSKNEIKCGIN